MINSVQLTKEQIKHIDINSDEWDTFLQQHTTTPYFRMTDLVGKVSTGDLLSLAYYLLPQAKIAKFACEVALINIERIKLYTDRVEEVVTFLHNPTTAAIAVNNMNDIIGSMHGEGCLRIIVSVDRAVRTVIAPWDYTSGLAHATAYSVTKDGSPEDIAKVDDLLREMFTI